MGRRCLHATAGGEPTSSYQRTQLALIKHSEIGNFGYQEEVMVQKGYSNCGWCGEFLAILPLMPKDVVNDNLDLCIDCGQYPKRREMLRDYQKELKMRNIWERIRLGTFSIAVLGGLYMVVMIFLIGLNESPF